MMAMWSDVGVLDGQFVCMVGDSSGVVQFRKWNGGNPELISQVSFGRTAAQYRMCVAGGRCYAVAQVGDRLDECCVIRDDGKVWNSGDGAHGVNCVGLWWGGKALSAVWVRRGGSSVASVDLTLDLAPVGSGMTTFPFGPTSQGFVLLSDGNIFSTDLTMPAMRGDAIGYLWHIDGGWDAFQENGNPERVSVASPSGDLFLVAEAHTEAPPRVAVITNQAADIDDTDDVLVAIGGHDWFVPRAQFQPWTPPNTAPAPTPIPVPEPTPEPQPMPNTISGSEITSIVAQAKRDVEATGVTFKTPEQATADFTAEDKRKAFLVTMRAAWELASRYPNAGIGLEAYDGFSGVPSPFPEDGPQKYSFDIILLGRSGPSADVMGAGVTPTAQIEEHGSATTIEAWQRDWRPVLNPNRGASQPTPQPQPEPAPQPTPTPQPDAVLAFLKELDGKVDALADLVAATVDVVTPLQSSVRETADAVKAIRFPTYRTRILGQSVTLTPEGQ